MNLPDNLLDENWYWVAWAAWGWFALRSIRQAPWARLKDSLQSNFWMGSIVILVFLWSLKAGVKPGLTLHLLGATAFTLCFGPHLAFIGLSLVLAGVTLNGTGDWTGFALSSLLTSGVGVAVSWRIYGLVDRWLPKNLFVYVFVNGFFGSALTLMVVGLGICLLLGVSGVYSLEYLFGDYLPYFLLLGFSEAWLSGMVMTLLVVYRPELVATFDDARYLSNK